MSSKASCSTSAASDKERPPFAARIHVSREPVPPPKTGHMTLPEGKWSIAKHGFAHVWSSGLLYVFLERKGATLAAVFNQALSCIHTQPVTPTFLNNCRAIPAIWKTDPRSCILNCIANQVFPSFSKRKEELSFTQALPTTFHPEPIQVLNGHGAQPINALCCHLPGGCFATSSEDSTVVIWAPSQNNSSGAAASSSTEVFGYRPIKRLEGLTRGVNTLAYLPSKNQIAAGSSDKEIFIWDLTTGECVQKLLHGGPVHSICFLGDHLVSAGLDRRVLWWDLTSGKPIKQYTCDSETVYPLCPLENGEVAYGSPLCFNVHQTIKVCDLGGAKEPIQLAGSKPRWVGHLSQTLEGDLKSPKRLLWGAPIQEFPKHLEHHVHPPIYFPLIRLSSGQLAYIRETDIHIYNPKTKTHFSIKGTGDRLDMIVSLCEWRGLLVSGSVEGWIKVWNPQTGKILQAFKGSDHEIRTLVALPRGELASAGRDGMLKIWHPAAEIAASTDLTDVLDMAIHTMAQVAFGGDRETKTAELVCRISFELFKNPVTLPCGHNFEYTHLTESFKRNRECPTCRAPVPTRIKLNTNYDMKKLADRVRVTTPPIFAPPHVEKENLEAAQIFIEAAKKLEKQGLAYHALEQYKFAMKFSRNPAIYSQFIKYYSSCEEKEKTCLALLYLAKLYAEKGQMGFAIKSLMKAADSQADYQELLYPIARYLDRSGRKNEAHRFYQRLIPYFEAKKNRKMVIECLEACIACRPDLSECYEYLARLYPDKESKLHLFIEEGWALLLYRAPQAESHCRNLIDFAPDRPDAYHPLLTLLKKRETPEARAEQAAIYQMLAKLYHEQKNTREERGCLTQAAKIYPRAHTFAPLIECLEREKHQKALAKYFFSWVQHHIARNEWAEAEAVAERAQTTLPETPELLWKQLEKIYRKQNSEKLGDFFLSRGLFLETTGNSGKAMPYYRYAWEVSKIVDGCNALIRLLKERARIDEALYFCRDLYNWASGRGEEYGWIATECVREIQGMDPEFKKFDPADKETFEAVLAPAAALIEVAAGN